MRAWWLSLLSDIFFLLGVFKGMEESDLSNTTENVFAQAVYFGVDGFFKQIKPLGSQLFNKRATV